MTKQTSNKFSPEVRERAVRMVFDHQIEHASQWATITSIASKIGCNPETLRSWVRQAERDEGKRAGLNGTCFTSWPSSVSSRAA
jgi:transposase